MRFPKVLERLGLLNTWRAVCTTFRGMLKQGVHWKKLKRFLKSESQMDGKLFWPHSTIVTPHLPVSKIVQHSVLSTGLRIGVFYQWKLTCLCHMQFYSTSRAKPSLNSANRDKLRIKTEAPLILIRLGEEILRDCNHSSWASASGRKELYDGG